MDGRAGALPRGVWIYITACGLLVSLFGQGLVVAATTNVALRSPHAIIRQGNLKGYKWWVITHRDRGPSAARRPCIDVSIGEKPTRLGFNGISTVCGTVDPIPNIIGASAGPAGRERTVLAFAFGLRSRRVVVDLGERGRRLLSLSRLNTHRADRAKVSPFRFLVMSLVGPFCVHRVSAYDQQRKKVSDSGVIPCG